MGRESLNAFADQHEGFVERLSMEKETSQPQVIPMTERRRRKFAAREGCQEFLITELRGCDDDRHISSTIARGLQLEQLRVTPSRRQQLLMRAQLRNVPIGDDRDPVGDTHGRKPMRDHDADPPFEILL